MSWYSDVLCGKLQTTKSSGYCQNLAKGQLDDASFQIKRWKDTEEALEVTDPALPGLLLKDVVPNLEG